MFLWLAKRQTNKKPFKLVKLMFIIHFQNTSHYSSATDIPMLYHPYTYPTPLREFKLNAGKGYLYYLHIPRMEDLHLM